MASTTADKVGSINTALEAMETHAQPVTSIDVSNHLYEIGNPTLGTNESNQSSNSLYTLAGTLPAGDFAGVAMITWFAGAATKGIALYDDNAGAPDALLYSEAGFTATGVADQWIHHLLAAPFAVAAGRYHWGFLNSSGTLYGIWNFASLPSGEFHFQTGTSYPTFPDPMVPSTNTNRPPYLAIFQGPVQGDLFVGGTFLTGQARVYYLHGELSADVVLNFNWEPGIWQVINNTTGAFKVKARYLQNLASTARQGGGIEITQGDGAWIYGNTFDLFFVDPTKGTKV